MEQCLDNDGKGPGKWDTVVLEFFRKICDPHFQVSNKFRVNVCSILAHLLVIS